MTKNQIKTWTEVKQYLHFLNVKIRRMVGQKTLRISAPTICTTKEIVTIGQEYQYKEGGMLERIIVEDISFRNMRVFVKVHFIDLNRTTTCDHLMKPAGYMGMWRIWDKDQYDIEEWKAECSPIDPAGLDNIPIIFI